MSDPFAGVFDSNNVQQSNTPGVNDDPFKKLFQTQQPQPQPQSQTQTQSDPFNKLFTNTQSQPNTQPTDTTKSTGLFDNLDSGALAGAYHGVANFFKHAGDLAVRYGTDIDGSRYVNLAQDLSSIKDQVTGHPVSATGNAITGLVKSTLGTVGNVADLTLDLVAKGSKIAQAGDSALGMGGLDKFDLIGNLAQKLNGPGMTDQQRYDAGNNIGQTAAILAVSHGMGSLLGEGAKAASAFNTLGIPANATADEILNTYIPKAVASMPTGDAVNMITKLGNTSFGAKIAQGIAIGSASGAVSGLMQDAADGQDVAKNVFNYGIAGGLLSVPFEVAGMGWSKLRGRSLASPQNIGLANNIRASVADNLTDLFTPEAAPLAAHQIAMGADIVTSIKDGSHRGLVVTLSGLPDLTPEQLADPTIGKFTDPETGLIRARITGQGLVDNAITAGKDFLSQGDVGEDGKYELDSDKGFNKDKGKLITVYHGSSHVFDEPRPGTTLGGTAIYTSDDPVISDTFAESPEGANRVTDDALPNVHAFHLNTTPDKVLNVPVDDITDRGFSGQSVPVENYPPEVAQRLTDAANRLVQKTIARMDELNVTPTLENHPEYQKLEKSLKIYQNTESAIIARGVIKTESIADIAKEAGYDAVRFNSSEHESYAPQTDWENGEDITDKLNLKPEIHQVTYPARNEYAIMNPDILVRPWDFNHTVSTMSPEELKFYGKNGYNIGEGVSHNGTDHIILDKAGDQAKIINTQTGEISTVDPSELTQATVPKFYDVTKTSHAPVKIPSIDNSTVPVDPDYGATQRNLPFDTMDLQDHWDQIYNNLDDKGKQFVDENTKYFNDRFKGQVRGDFATLLGYGQYADVVNGNLLVKDMNTSKLITTLKNIDDLREYTKSLSTPPDVSNTLTDLSPIAIPTNVLSQEAATPVKMYDRYSVTNLKDTANQFLHPLVPMIEKFRTLARKSYNETTGGIDLTKEVHDVQAANLRKRALANPYITRLNNLLSPILKGDPDANVKFNTALTTRSAADILRYGIRDTPAPMTDVERSLASDLHTILPDIDDRHVALRYATERSWIQDNEVMNDKTKQDMLASLDQQIQPTDAQKQWADKYASIKGDPDRLTITSYLDAKDTNAPTREEYIKNNKISPAIINAVYGYENMMRDLGTDGGVSTESMLNGYMPRIARAYGTSNIESILSHKNIGSGTRQFGNLLQRIGYYGTDELVNDPLNATAKYITGIFHHNTIEPELVKLEDKLKDYNNQAQIDPVKRTAWRGSLNGAATMVKDLRDLTRNIPNAEDVARKSSARANFAKLATNDNHVTDFARLWQQGMEFKFQGFKPIASIRDMSNTIYSYMMFHGLNGPKMAAKLFATASESFNNKTLAESGVTPTITPTRTESVNEPIAKGNWNSIVNTGFKWSGQPLAYKTGYNMVYLTEFKNTLTNMSDLGQGKITRAQFEKNINLARYDGSDQTSFNQMLDSGDNKGAADFLARRAGESTVGLYGTLNAPSMYRTSVGKVAGQFGQWGLWQMQNVARNLAQGSSVDRAATLAMLAGSYYTAEKIKEKLGVNLMSWVFSPDQLIPSGSPVLGLVNTAKDLTRDNSKLRPWVDTKRQNIIDMINNPSGYTVGNVVDNGAAMPQEMNDATNTLTPIPLEMTKAEEAVKRLNAGQPLHIIGQVLMGGTVDNTQYPKPQ